MKRALWFALFLFSFGLFFAARNAASWRPKLLEVTSKKSPDFQFSPDGRWLLIQNRNSQSGTLWDWRERHLVREVAPGSYQFSPDGNFLMNASMSREKLGATRTSAIRVKILETASGQLVETLADPKARAFDALLDARWSMNGKNLVVATRFGCRTFDAASGKIVSRWEADNLSPANIGTQISPDGRQIARILLHNSEVRRTDNGHFVRSLPFGPTGTSLTGFSPDNHWIYSVSNDGRRVHFWQGKRLERKWELFATANTAEYRRPHFTRAPGTLAFATPDGLELRSIAGGKVIEKLGGPTSEPFALAPDESSAVSCDARGQIFRWRLR